MRCPVEFFCEQLAHTLPASLTVLEIDSGLVLSPEQIAACHQLKTIGFRFALDNLGVELPDAQVLELADYLKVDLDRTPPEVRRGLFDVLRHKAIAMLAKNVNTHADFRRALDEGFTLFEGFYFCKPQPIRNRRPPVNQMLRLDILKALQMHPLNLQTVGRLVKRDGPLTYQLLRLVNSPLWGMRQNVESIEVALVAVGENAFRRIATLAIAGEFNGDQPAELLCMAILRGRICEVMAASRNLDPFAQYLLGLLSLLPAMQGQPMSEIAPTLPLDDAILQALLGGKNPERGVLTWLECCERGDWAGCDSVAQAEDLDQKELARIYVESVAWTEAAIHAGA